MLSSHAAKKKPVAPSAKKKSKADEKQNDMLNPDDADISPKSLSETLLSEDGGKNAKSKLDNDTKDSNKDDNLVDFVIEKDDAA